MLNPSQTINTALNQLYLELPQQHLKDVNQLSVTYSSDVACRNAYMNNLCLQTLTEWLNSELDLPPETITAWPNQAALPSIWDVVNGTALQVGQTRIVLIPSEANTLDELCVPFEWVDIPTWAAPYYLAVQVNLEDDTEWLRVWGFATHQQVKAGEQDPVRRVYSLPRQNLTESLNVLWVAQDLGLTTLPEVTALPPLSPDRAEQLITQLGQPTPYSPRLEVPFADWAALLEHDDWRQQLYEQRQQAAVLPVLSTPLSAQPTMPTIVNLQHWLRQTIAEHWQTVELLLAPLELSPARGRVQAEEDTAQNAIAAAIRLLQTSPSEPIRRQAAGMLGEIGAGQPEAVASLVELLQQTEDEETRWQAALSLGKLDPAHPLAGVRKARILDLDGQPDVPMIVLSVAILPKSNDRIGVWLQLQPVDQRVKLPPHLQLSVLSASGETRLATEARQDEQGQGQDQAIELRFSPPAAAHFQVRVTLGSTSITADFAA
ncbi:DUF1822 family protein [Pantanalinema sp. GBBB05]|uniref:DUF1822 family protein n=1 Tax=Pantanalinema sp. GBBB05 TaxID=2604139 RepID=UPI001D3526A7|nr:DUF1822 family protein [Pantanalinema sp. GBBB05]